MKVGLYYIGLNFKIKEEAGKTCPVFLAQGFMKKLLLALTVLVLSCSFVFAGGAKEPATADMSNYPSKSITFIVNRGAGGSTDLVARAVANSIQHDKGITTAVVNYEGGDGLIGVAELMNSAPDGYTFCVIGCTEIPNMLANFEEAGFTKEDLFPVCHLPDSYRLKLYSGRAYDSRLLA